MNTSLSLVSRGNAVPRDGRMSYAEFVWFLISEEDKKNPTRCSWAAVYATSLITVAHPKYCLCACVCSLQHRVLVPLHGHWRRWRLVHVWAGVFLWGTVWEDGEDGNRTPALPGSALPDARLGQTREPRLVQHRTFNTVSMYFLSRVHVNFQLFSFLLFLQVR